MQICSYLSSWISHLLSSMGASNVAGSYHAIRELGEYMTLNAALSSRSCLGCCSKPHLIISVDEPSKEPGIQGQSVTRSDRLDEFWSSSTLDMDNSALPSVSSVSTSNHTIGRHNSDSMNNPPEFVNQGLLLWSQVRQQWIGRKQSQSRKQALEPRLSLSASYDGLLGSNKCFPQPIPLPEMVEFLGDVWEQEGLYD